MEVILKRERRLRVGGRYCRAISLPLVLHRCGLPALCLIHAPVSESHHRRSCAAYLERHGNGVAWLEGARRGVRAGKRRARGARLGELLSRVALGTRYLRNPRWLLLKRGENLKDEQQFRLAISSQPQDHSPDCVRKSLSEWRPCTSEPRERARRIFRRLRRRTRRCRRVAMRR